VASRCNIGDAILRIVVLSFPVRTWANESSLRIEFLLDQDHRQIWPLCLDQRGDFVENLVAIAALGDSPASTIPFWPRSVRVLLT
jgi:hypothetical protein